MSLLLLSITLLDNILHIVYRFNNIIVYFVLYIAVPSKIPDVFVISELVSADGDNVTLTLSWDEPFDNFNPILSYTISCTSRSACPAAVTVYNTTSVNLKNLMARTMYTFSVIATNSIGNGEAGVLNITTASSKLHKLCSDFQLKYYIHIKSLKGWSNKYNRFMYM